MSRYRDDTQETAFARDTTWVKIGALVEDSAKAASKLLFALMVAHTEVAVASDQVQDNARSLLADQASASDAATGRLRAAVLLADNVKAFDRVIVRQRVLLTETAIAADTVIDKTRSIASDRAAIADAVVGQRRAHSLISETIRGRDFTGQFSMVLISETGTASDWAGGRVHTRQRVLDGAIAADELLDAHRAVEQAPTERARAFAVVLDRLHARDLVQDGAVVEDSMPAEHGSGQAWTANADRWAMSRYAPFTFNGLAVIDGVLYGTTDDGVYALSAGSEEIEARMVTGKVDVGKGMLVHPVAAYLEYELDADGAATMDVSTTQSGATETYSYPLESEPAAELTNGRIVFGRGLRSRHFGFTLRLTARHAYINDLRVDSAPTKRRV